MAAPGSAPTSKSANAHFPPPLSKLVIVIAIQMDVRLRYLCVTLIYIFLITSDAYLFI